MSPNTPTFNSVEDLERAGVRYVRITWVDLINFVRYRVVPIAHFKKLLASGGKGYTALNHEGRAVLVNKRSGVTLTKAALGLVYIALAEGFGATGEYLYAVDMKSTRLLAYAEGHASVLGWFQEKEARESAVSGRTMDTIFACPLCPRKLLKQIVDEASNEAISFLVGFETEVIFLSSTDPIETGNDYGWSESGALNAGNVETRVSEEIAEALEKSGIELQMYHAEAAPGQYEFITGPLPPLEAVDALIVTRETIVNVASKYGLRATLAPRVFPNNCGSASHVHISLKSTAPSAHPDPSASGLSTIESSFLQGLLTHLPAITALTLPTPASYARMVDGAWSGGTYVAWGRDNRECPVRLCGRPGGYNFEVKALDGTANPYLATAALLAGGLDGVRTGAQLAVRNAPDAPALLTEAERRALGVVQRMPLNIHEAREALKKDEVLVQALGEEFVSAYLRVNETLAVQLEAGSPEATIKRLVNTY